MFFGQKDFRHDTEPKVGILVLNLGTPDAPTPRALRRYLREFLLDKRVIEIWRPLWLFLLFAVVLPFRPKRSAALYKKVWTERGSPLMFNTSDQTKALESQLRERYGPKVIVEFAMRYGNPSIPSVLERMQNAGMTKLLVLPMYPQYSATTTASIFDGVVNALKTWRWVPEFRMVTNFHDHPTYIAAIADSIRKLWAADGEPDKLVFSFHGIPKRYFLGGDPYHCNCHKTARLVAEALKLPKEKYMVCFQSLFGREEWLRPYTADTLEVLGKEGVGSLDVICPGFTADCLETIEEIDEENREKFLHAGGKQFRYIPALNASAGMIQTLVELVDENARGWLHAGLIAPTHRAAPTTQELFEKMQAKS